jgi:glycosyltransferase involved in cell wall biosynthesis
MNDENKFPHIVVDVRLFHASGIGTYLQHVLPLIVHAHSEVQFTLLGQSNNLYQYDWIHGKNIQVIDCRVPIYSVKEQFEILKKIPKKASLFWSPHFNIPFFYKGNLLVTIYDVFHLAMPELVGGFHKQMYAKIMFHAIRRKAKAILTISEFTKKEIVRFTVKGSQEIYPIHLGVDDSWFKIASNTRPYSKPFLLFVGNVKPHKNLSVLIKAFGSIADKIPHDLVIAGKKEGFITGDKEVLSRARKLGNRIHFTGFLEEDILKEYFAHAAALVFPSLYEGFGLPPLEAMAAGCPVIASDAGALPEVCGDAALYFNPNSSEEIANRILELLNNQLLRESLRSKGYDRAKIFNWATCANETKIVIDRLLAYK